MAKSSKKTKKSTFSSVKVKQKLNVKPVEYSLRFENKPQNDVKEALRCVLLEKMCDQEQPNDLPELFTTQQRADIDLNTVLGDLINSRSSTYDQITAIDDQNSSKVVRSSYIRLNTKLDGMSSIDMQKRVRDLKYRLLVKQSRIHKVKSKTETMTHLKSATDSFELQTSSLLKITKCRTSDVEQYVKQLRKLRSELKQHELPPSEHDVVKPIARYQTIIESLDRNGITLNDKLQQHITDINSYEDTLSTKIDHINELIDSRADVKEECRQIDDQVTSLASATKTKIELLVRDLSRVVKQKNVLKTNIMVYIGIFYKIIVYRKLKQTTLSSKL